MNKIIVFVFFMSSCNLLNKNGLRHSSEKEVQVQVLNQIDPALNPDFVESIQKDLKNGHIDSHNDLVLTSENLLEHNKKNEKLVKTVAVGLVVASAVLVGVPVAKYLSSKAKYIKGFSNSADLAIVMAKTDKLVSKLPGEFRTQSGPSEALTIVLGGMDGQGGASADYLIKTFYNMQDAPNGSMIGLQGKAFQGQFFSPFYLEHFRTDGPLTMNPESIVSYVKLIYKKMSKGYNEESVALASNVIAFQKKFPDKIKVINIVGTSGTLPVAAEAAAILKKAGIEVKTIGVGGVNLNGFLPHADVNLVSPYDPLRSLGGDSARQISFSSVTGHMDFFQNNEVKAFLEWYLKLTKEEAKKLDNQALNRLFVEQKFLPQISYAEFKERHLKALDYGEIPYMVKSLGTQAKEKEARQRLLDKLTQLEKEVSDNFDKQIITKSKGAERAERSKKQELANVFKTQVDMLKKQKEEFLKEKSNEAFLEYRKTVLEDWKNVPGWLAPGFAHWIKNIMKSESKPNPPSVPSPL